MFGNALEIDVRRDEGGVGIERHLRDDAIHRFPNGNSLAPQGAKKRRRTDMAFQGGTVAQDVGPAVPVIRRGSRGPATAR